MPRMRMRLSIVEPSLLYLYGANVLNVRKFSCKVRMVGRSDQNWDTYTLIVETHCNK